MPRLAVIYHSETGNTKRMAELILEGCLSIEGTEAQIFSLDEIDREYIDSADAVLLGSPTYEGSPSWKMKKFLDRPEVNLAGKLGGVFASQNWPGGGGASFAEMTLIAAMLIRGMLIYSGGITQGEPYLHFGAVSTRSPEGIYAERCLKLGQTISTKAKEIFGR